LRTPLLLSAVLALTPVGDPIPQPAQAALERATRHYSDGRAHTATFAQTYTPAGFAGAKRESGGLDQAPQRLRFSTRRRTRRSSPTMRARGALPPGPAVSVKLSPGRARLPIVFSPTRRLSAAYAITIEPADGGSGVYPGRGPSGRACLVAPGDRPGRFGRAGHEDEGGNKTDFASSWRGGPSDADFHVTGPKGLSVVEQ
jgi:hypothetical protein